MRTQHVPLVQMPHNITSACENNIIGTYNLAKAAIDSGVNSFVMISTDKAVRPTSVMGFTKRIAELVILNLNHDQNKLVNKTKFTIVRFGNVIGSSGSAIPLFKKQIQDGGPVTVTDPEVIRYFMTINEAAILVLQSTSLISKNDIFVLDMGKPIKILNLAKRMIRLSGLVEKDEKHPNGNIEIKFTGLRPGEKLHEELIVGNTINKTENPISIIKAY